MCYCAAKIGKIFCLFLNVLFSEVGVYFNIKTDRLGENEIKIVSEKTNLRLPCLKEEKREVVVQLNRITLKKDWLKEKRRERWLFMATTCYPALTLVTLSLSRDPQQLVVVLQLMWNI